MQVATTIAQARALFDVFQQPIGFVPTMGALHAGHLELVRRARDECSSVAASVFVNPMQFGAGEDLAGYPRDFESDCKKLQEAGVDVLFAPDPTVMYPPGFSTSIDVGAIATVYEGAIRPEHFRGVATVVAKLLNVVRPGVLYLGQKDAQQTAVIGKMVRDLDIPVHVQIVATVRESDGLAMSSRNAYLTAEQRAAAVTLHRALLALVEALQNGQSKSGAIALARETLSPIATPDYFDVVDALSFEPLERARSSSFTIGAARFGTTRLLDNIWMPG
jgi:pantoate--beta-alanine ligase